MIYKLSFKVEYFNGKKYIREDSIWGDYAIIKANMADTNGNLKFVGTARNFN
jgi:3-oxoacid CoA-transferase